jgi:putative transposase
VHRVIERFRTSERRTCRLLRFERSSHRYRSRKQSVEPLLRRLRELARTRPRYGYRRLHVLLRREGWRVNQKKTYRLYHDEALMLRTRRRRKHVSQPRLRPAQPTRRNELWSLTSWQIGLRTARATAR